MSHPIILHHYDDSPFSEKVRLVLGLKNLSWRSVQIPNVMPRPDLMPMTGGYRRTPVMQIGSDIYCDTAAIVDELERRVPEPTLFPAGTAGAAWAVASWTDRPFFQASVGVIFGSMPDAALPESFLRDREELTGRKFDLASMRKAVPVMKDQWLAHAHLVERQLETQRARGHAYLLGAEPSYADLTTHMNFWFLRNASSLYDDMTRELPSVRGWMGRIDAIGHGEREEMESAEALEIACRSRPEEMPSDAAGPPEDEPGTEVTVTPDDYGRVPVRGTLVLATPRRIAVRRSDERAGDLVVHFPRIGFHVVPAA